MAKVENRKAKKEAAEAEMQGKDGRGGKAVDDSECCADCGKAVLTSQQGVKCDACEYWHHCECEGVDEEIYSFLCDHEEPSLKWFCRKCTAICGGLKAVWKALTEQQQRMEEKIEELAMVTTARIDELAAAVHKGLVADEPVKKAQQEENQRRMEEKVDELTTVLRQQRKADDLHLQAISIQRQEETEEIDEIKKRRANVIIHGLAEATGTDDDNGREQDDEAVLNLLHQMKCDTLSVQSVTRLGRKQSGEPNGKPRPVRLIMASEDQKETILTRAKNLRKIEGMAKVFIHQDLTPKQRMKRKALVSEVKEREQKGEKDLIIINWKIVTRRHSADKREEDLATKTQAAAAPAAVMSM